MARLGAALLVLPLLAGCAQPPRAPLWRAEHGLVWCYATLADADCHDRPVPGAEGRLIAVAPETRFAPACVPAVDICGEND